MIRATNPEPPTWSRTHASTVRGLKAEQVWTDIIAWHNRQPDIERAYLDGEFAVGSTFARKPKGAPQVRIEIVVSLSAKWRRLTQQAVAAVERTDDEFFGILSATPLKTCTALTRALVGIAPA